LAAEAWERRMAEEVVEEVVEGIDEG